MQGKFPLRIDKKGHEFRAQFLSEWPESGGNLRNRITIMSVNKAKTSMWKFNTKFRFKQQAERFSHSLLHVCTLTNFYRKWKGACFRFQKTFVGYPTIHFSDILLRRRTPNFMAPWNSLEIFDVSRVIITWMRIGKVLSRVCNPNLCSINCALTSVHSEIQDKLPLQTAGKLSRPHLVDTYSQKFLPTWRGAYFRFRFQKTFVGTLPFASLKIFNTLHAWFRGSVI